MSDQNEKKEFELHSLRNLLGLTPHDFPFLEKLTAEDLNILKNQFLKSVQDGQREIFVTIAKVSRYMPNFLNAKVSQDILGPQITANLSYYLSAKEAISIANYFPTKFFADVIEYLVPEKISEMISLTPFDQMRKAVDELISRNNFFVIGSLMDYTPLGSVDKIARGILDPGHLILITYNCQDKARVLDLFQKFGEKRIFDVISRGLKPDLFMEMKIIFEHANEELIEFTKKSILENDSELIQRYEEMLG
ncbi:MAG: hypothetical protein SH817_05985 [Leptospira sp.]|nr:hypothetical protein [Leptospira sp.]